MKVEKSHIVGTAIKSNNKIVERGRIYTTTHKYMTFSWLGTGISIESGTAIPPIHKQNT